MNNQKQPAIIGFIHFQEDDFQLFGIGYAQGALGRPVGISAEIVPELQVFKLYVEAGEPLLRRGEFRPGKGSYPPGITDAELSLYLSLLP